jgi:ubiquinone biosynthesis protein UbiJ
MRIGPDIVTVDGTSGSVRLRRGTADRPQATLTTDAGTLHDVTLGMRSIADAVKSGDLRLDGDPGAVTGLTGLLLALATAA